MGGKGIARITRIIGRLAVALLIAATACTSAVDEQVKEARRQAEAGDLPAAMRTLRSALESDPDNVEANHLLGVALLQSGDVSRAVPRLQRSLDDPRFGQEAGLLLASAFFQGQNYEEAIAAAGKVLAIHPDHPEALRLRATARLQTGDAEGCVEDAGRALRNTSGGDSALLILTATCLTRLGRLDEAEAALESAVATTRPGPAALRGNACAALADFQDTQRKDPKRAEALYRTCLKQDPAHAALLQAAGAFFERQERPEASLEILEAALAASPDDLRLQRTRASLLARAGRGDEAREALDEAAERLDSAEAWAAAGNLRRELGDPDAAAEAFAQAAQRADGDAAPALRFARADALIDAGRPEEARQEAVALAPGVFAHLVLGRLALERGDPQAALAEFDRGLAAWPNNAGARFLAGQAAERLGDPARAASEYREATRADPDATDAALHAARVALQLGQYAEAIRFAQRHVAHRVNGHGSAIAVAARARAAQGDPAAGRKVLETWLERHGADPEALAALADLSDDADAGARRIAESGLDLAAPENAVALRAWVDGTLRAGRVAEARARLERALANSPQDAALHDLHARILDRAGEADAATAELARALELDPDYGPALEASGRLRARAGDVDGALALLDRAAAAMPGDPEPAYAAAQLALASGAPDARTRLDALLERHPTHARAANDLAWLLAERGQELDRALALARAAARREDDPRMLDTLGWVHLQREEPEKARAVLEEALAKDPSLAGARYRLGLARLRSGDAEGAREALRQALATGDFPEAEAARAELARLEAARGGGAKPADAGDASGRDETGSGGSPP